MDFYLNFNFLRFNDPEEDRFVPDDKKDSSEIMKMLSPFTRDGSGNGPSRAFFCREGIFHLKKPQKNHFFSLEKLEKFA